MGNSQSLKNIYIFQNLTNDELEKIAAIGVEKTVHAGQDLFLSGQKAHSFYVVKMGSVKIYNTTKSGDDMSIVQFGTGSHFGEIPFLDQQERSANASATEPTTLIEFSYDRFRQLLESNQILATKVYFNFSKNLSGRLRATTQSLQQAQETKLRIA